MTATKKTGRQILKDNGFEKVMGDEFVTISPRQYAGKQSPLVAEITSDFDGRFDIKIPAGAGTILFPAFSSTVRSVVTPQAVSSR